MAESCLNENRSKIVETILTSIPLSNEVAVPLHTLCPFSNTYNSSCVACARTLVTFLEIFDAILVSSDNTEGEIRVKARSQVATYFLRSLAAYISKDLKLVSNWEREGVDIDLSAAHVLDSGAQLVYLLEHKRIVEYKDLSPIREECVSNAVIKAKIRGKSKPVYLVQFDEKARQYQLIGGRKRSTDPNPQTVMTREIDEELSQNHLKIDEDYNLEELVPDYQVSELSRTYGAYSRYYLTIYQAFIKSRQLNLGPNDSWISLSELLSGRTKAGDHVTDFSELNKQLHGGFKGLDLSLDEVQRRPISEIFKKKRYELIGIVIGIIGILLAIIFYII